MCVCGEDPNRAEGKRKATDSTNSGKRTKTITYLLKKQIDHGGLSMVVHAYNPGRRIKSSRPI